MRDPSSVRDPSPIANSIRKTVYGPDGEPVVTEWQILDDDGIIAGNRRVAIVTGIRPGGIGEATTKRLAIEEGFEVFTLEREQSGRQAVDRIRQQGGRVRFVQGDASKPEDIKRLLDTVAEDACRLDLLVCNAAQAGNKEEDQFGALTPEKLKRFFGDNFLSAYVPVDEALRRFFLPQRFGVVVFLASYNGKRGPGALLGQPAYAIAKSGLTALQAILVARFGRHVRFCTVLPGLILTNSPNYRKRLASKPNWKELEGQYCPAGRLGKPEEVAAAIAWLASDQARYVNGVELSVDGGFGCAGLQFPAWDPADFRASYVAAVEQLLEESLLKKAA
jgi:NAD(P)-dependent dehydrogenase (short-subunit alcohol dehydrogenase family)